MNLGQVRKIDVHRVLASGSRAHVGTLAQNRDGVYFEYSSEYLNEAGNLSPYQLNFDATLQKGPREPHDGLHGVFADSLPDSWGRLLVDRYLRQQGINPGEITAMDRLALVDRQSMGSLTYESDVRFDVELPVYSAITQLGSQAQALIQRNSDEGLRQLIYSGSAAGSRPKAQLYMTDDNDETCSLEPGQGLKPYLIKFTSSTFPLGHEEGVCEAIYMTLAEEAGIDVAPWRLVETRDSNDPMRWLAMERFDRIEQRNQSTEEEGRVHMHTVCGLTGADFRSPSLDYEDLIKLGSQLCRSPAVGQEVFRRAVFNLFSVNQDDHSRNWAFLQNDDGNWKLSPFYDVTYSPSPYGEHATAFGGYGKNPPLDTFQRLAELANYSRWEDARMVIEEVIEAIQKFKEIVREFDVRAETRSLIQNRIETAHKENIALLA